MTKNLTNNIMKLKVHLVILVLLKKVLYIHTKEMSAAYVSNHVDSLSTVE